MHVENVARSVTCVFRCPARRQYGVIFLLYVYYIINVLAYVYHIIYNMNHVYTSAKSMEKQLMPHLTLLGSRNCT